MVTTENATYVEMNGCWNLVVDDETSELLSHMSDADLAKIAREWKVREIHNQWETVLYAA